MHARVCCAGLFSGSADHVHVLLMANIPHSRRPVHPVRFSEKTNFLGGDCVRDREVLWEGW